MENLMMSRVLMILAVLLSLPPALRAQDVRPDGGGEVVPAPPAPKDCHGPLYYRMKEDDRRNRQAEQDVGVMQAFVDRLAPALFAAHKTEMAQKLEAQRAAHAKCLQEKTRPSLLCEAMARRDASRCDGLETPELQGPCRQLLLVYKAVTTKDATVCDGMGDAAGVAICRFSAVGRFACQEVGDPDLAAACQALEGLLAGTPLPTSLPAEMATALQWIAAIRRQETAACDALAEVPERNACRALLQADASHCQQERAVSEAVDGDFSCRQPLVYKAEHPAAWGNLVALTVASAVPGVGQCEVFVDLLEAGVKRTMKAGEVTLSSHGTWQQIQLFTGQGRLIDVRVPCQWRLPAAPTDPAAQP
jgi:hypothetical protein